MLTGKLLNHGEKRMKKGTMQALRLTKTEEKEVNKKWMEISRLMMEKGLPPMTEPAFLHLVIELGLKKITLNTNNQIVLDVD
jgi:hypothetical protein